MHISPDVGRLYVAYPSLGAMRRPDCWDRRGEKLYSHVFFCFHKFGCFSVNGDDGWQGSAGQHTYCVPSTQTPRCKPEKQKTTNTFIYYQTLLTIKHFKRMKKHFLLLLLMTLLPLAGWSANIAVQLSTSLEKVYGSADPTILSPTQFVIISTGGAAVTEADIAPYLTFKRKPGSTGESVGTYDWEVTVSDGWTGAPIVPTNTGRISITPLDLSTAPLSAGWTGAPFTYDGNAKEPNVTNVQVGGFTLLPTDYNISYDNNVNAGTGTAKIIITAASGNVTGSNNDITFSIAKRTLTSVTIADIAPVPYKKAAYDFESLQVSVTGKDAQNNEYAMQLTDFNEPVLENATNAGTGTITLEVKADGNFAYAEPVAKTFTIEQRDISNISIGAISSEYVYNGKAKEPKPALKDFGVNLPNADFTRTWSNNIDAGEGTMTVTGNHNYTGTIEVKFNIAKKDLSTVTIADIEEQTYNGEAKTPVLTVSFNNGSEDVNLEKDVHYTVSYENNTTAGTATATITAVDNTNYKGTATKEFTINPVTVYIKPVDQSKFYGQADPNFAQATTAMYELVDGEGHAVEGAVLNGTVVLGRKAGETVGNYAIYVKPYTPNPNPEVVDNYKPDNEWYTDDDHLGNYTAIFTINAQEAKLILKFKEGTLATKVYGDPTPTYTKNDLEVVSGLAGSDTWETLKEGATFTPTLESELVHYDGNKVTATITGLANYPNIEVQPLAFTVTKRKFGVKPSNQTKDYGADISKAKTYWAKATASTYAFSEGKDDVLVELYTDEDVATFAPGSVNEGVIKARIADESNYELDEENSVWGTLTINAAAELALDDSKDDNLTKIAAFDGKQVDDVTIKFSSRNGRDLGGVRKWGQYDWMTLTLPFDISVADLSKALGYAIVNVIDDSKTVVSAESSKFYGKLTMTGGNGYVDPTDPDNDAKKDTKLAANKPFLVKTDRDINGVIHFGAQTIVAPASEADLTVDAGQEATFVGTYALMPVTSADGAKKWFQIGGGYTSWAFIKSTSSATWDLMPTEAYIQLPIESKSIVFNFEDVDGGTTAIKSIDVDNLSGKVSAEGWYTLNGVKLQGAPTEKGVYIKDGKKVVIK